MQASINLRYFPKIYKSTITVVLGKPRKPDYTKAKAYHPIALKSALGKVLESVIADIISYLKDMYKLLSVYHFGKQPAKSTEDAIMILLEDVHKA